jgi:general secretion pathway protein F
MASFRYRAVGPDGALASGVVEGDDQPQALDRLRAMGLVPVEAVPGDAETKPWWQRDLKLGGGPDSKGLATLVEEMAVLLDAGMPLDRALASLMVEAEHKALRPVLEKVLDKVRAGTPLGQAITEFPKVFPPIAVALVEAGEAAGALQAALARLATMLQRAEQLQEQLRSALVYPVLLVVAAAGSVTILLGVVVPQFEAFFEDGRVALPLASEVVLAASRLLRDQGALLALLALGVVLGLRHLAGTPGGRLWLDQRLLRAPMLGALLAKVETARFARTLGTLLESGVALTEGLAIATRTFGNQVMAAAVGGVANQLKQGQGLARPLEATGLLPPIAVTFLRTGEETGRLGDMLGRLADTLDRDIQKSTQRLMALLVPVITIVLGLVVAVIVGAILTAMLSLNELAA